MGLIDWQKPAIEIERLIRGLNPWPSAFSYLDGKTIKLWHAIVEEGLGQPGTIIAVEKNGFSVACGQGSLFVTELQLEGKKRMMAADFLRGYQLKEGQRLEDGRD